MIVSIVEVVCQDLFVIEAEGGGNFPGGEDFDGFGIVLGGGGACGGGDEDDTDGMLSGVSIRC